MLRTLLVLAALLAPIGCSGSDGSDTDELTPRDGGRPPDVDEGRDADERDVNVETSCTPFPETCNGEDDDCDGVVDEGRSDDCPDACCSPNLVCNAAEGCVPAECEGVRCGVDAELCCTSGSICWGNACVVADTACDGQRDCEDGTICEPDLGVCVPGDVATECEYRPPPGVFDPVLACRWTAQSAAVNLARRDVVATPIVLNLTDDDGNGITDRNDIPDLAFLTYSLANDGCCNQPATLRVVSGDCEPDGTMLTHASISAPQLTNDAGIAGGDLDGDGVPELIAISRIDGKPQGTVAFRRTAPDGSAWDVLWHNTTYPTWDVHTRGGATISIANVNGAGAPEVVIGNVILDGLTGDVLYDGAERTGGAGGVGNNAFLGPAGTVADVDLDGVSEIVAGNTLYTPGGRVLWTFEYPSENSPCGGQLPCDGFDAVADFDRDPYAEIVIVRRGEVYVLEHDGELLHSAVIPRIDCANNESGPPTVADFDGDGKPEIGTASADYYVVVDFDTCDTPAFAARGCAARAILWMVPNQDCSSRATGSSVFDFDGDGRAEVVYADETTLRIFDGTNGDVLYEDGSHGSHTRIEMPIIVDVDNDGNAEIVVPENGYNGGVPGVAVWADAADNWVRTRRIWNQHGYTITNVTEDGTIPLDAAPNWTEAGLNNFRQNVQPDAVFAAPDLAVADASLVLGTSKCPYEVQLQISVTVRNDGALSVAPGARGTVEVTDPGGTTVAAEFETTRRLFPGAAEILTFDIAFPLDSIELPVDVRIAIDTDGAVNECREDNNAFVIADIDCSWGIE